MTIFRQGLTFCIFSFSSMISIDSGHQHSSLPGSLNSFKSHIPVGVLMLTVGPVKSASMGTKSLRWMFWILVMTLKDGMGWFGGPGIV